MIALQGVLLFLFIPLVLYLYLFFPLGILPSFAIAIPVMFLHRFAARPWMARHRNRRCLWCGRETGGEAVALIVGPESFVACPGAHHDLSGRFCAFVARRRVPAAAGIFLPLAVYLVTMLGTGLGHPTIPVGWDRFLFRGGIAVTVVAVSVLYRWTPAPAVLPPFPFPIHNLFLLGIRATLWVFRIVGVAWLVLAARFLVSGR